jgi:hypothetical protein
MNPQEGHRHNRFFASPFDKGGFKNSGIARFLSANPPSPPFCKVGDIRNFHLFVLKALQKNNLGIAAGGDANKPLSTFFR